MPICLFLHNTYFRLVCVAAPLEEGWGEGGHTQQLFALAEIILMGMWGGRPVHQNSIFT